MKVVMTGGSPWGFKMTGGKDFRQTLSVGKVTLGSKADRAGVKEGHAILSVNMEDVQELSHLAAQNKIKSCGQTLTLELSNAPLPKTSVSVTPEPVKQTTNIAPVHYKSASVPASTMSVQKTSPTPFQPHNKSNSYEDQKSATPDIEYHKVDSKDSHRRLTGDQESAEWRPSVHTDSTYQSPTFAALQRSGNAPHQSVLSPNAEKPQLLVSSEITDLINEEESSVPDGSMKAGSIKQWNPVPVNNSSKSPPKPTPPTTNTYSAPAPPPQSNGGANRSTAVGNISKFISSSASAGNVPKRGPPHFLKVLADFVANVGDPAVLEVRVGNCLPAPKVTWFHNGRQCHESREKDIRFLSKGSINTMVIGEFTTEFLGNYRCEVSNTHGSTSCRCNVTANNVTTTTYGSSTKYNSSPTTYQPPANNNHVGRTTTVSNPSSLYSSGNQQRAYEGQLLKKNSSRSSSEADEESAVMRALREQDENSRRGPIQSRSLQMLEDAMTLPESDDL